VNTRDAIQGDSQAQRSNAQGYVENQD